MIARNKFDDSLKVISDVASAHPDIVDFQKSAAKLTGTRDCFDVKVMFVGHFNAGKSALLNRLLSRDSFLQEAQTPQTAIATELKYGDQERYFAYLNGAKGTRRVQLQSHTDYNANQCDHLEYQLPVESLKNLSDFTIVDTPGFDSGVEQHTKALNAYIGQGSAYLLIMDVNEGELSQTSINFLQEITRYSPRIAVVLNKCDLNTQSNIQEISSQVEETLADNGFSCRIIATSKFDEDTATKLINLIGSFHAQDAFDEQMRRRILEECVSIRNLLQITFDALYMDTFDADKEIKKLETAKRFVKDSFEAQRKKFEQGSANQTQDIIDTIRAELLAKSTHIAQACMLGGASALGPIIIETVRPVIIEALRQSADTQLESIVKTLDFTSILGHKEGKSLGELLTNTANDIRRLIESGTFFKEVSDATDDKKDDDKKDDKGKDDNDSGSSLKNLYHIVAGLAAIATDFIAPWMEVLIIMAPDIINLCSKIFGQSALEKTRTAFETVVLPQITNRLYAPIDKAVKQSQDILLTAMKNATNEKLEALEQSIQEAKNAKAKKQDEFDKQRTALKAQIAALNEVEQKIEE